MNQSQPQTIKIYDLANKLKADTFWHIMKIIPGKFMSGEIIEVEATTIDGQKSKIIPCQITCAIIEEWSTMKKRDWLILSDIGMIGIEAEQFYTEWWKGVIPDNTRMIALCLSKRVVLPEPESELQANA